MKISLLILCLTAYSSVAIPLTDKHYRLKSLFTKHFGPDETTSCEVCKGLVGLLHAVGSAGVGEGELLQIATVICNRLKIEDKDVCDSVTKEFAGEVWNVFIDAFVDPTKVCGWVFGDSCAHFVDYYSPWNITIPQKKSPFSTKPWPQKKDITSKKILHFTDTHIDFDYEIGTKAVCGEPLCCRKESGMAGKNDTAAPKWGFQGTCDANTLLVNNMFEHIVANHEDIEYIIWTGDVPSHDVWNQSRANQIEMIKRATQLLLKYFPNVKIYPAVGNHEGAPVNSFPPPYITGTESLSWLLDALAEDWSVWLPEDTKETIKRGGYYTVLIEKGFRMVSLNMNYGNSGNWWLWINSTDPASQLQWLVSVLLKAEQNHEKVHIIGHIPPSSTLRWYTWNYYRVIDRFRDTITGQFFGHSHHDEFRIFYDIKTYKTPISVAYIGPSVTTFNYMNPGYRTYDIDAGEANSTWHVVNHDTYYLDLNKVDDTTEHPVWEHEYNAMDAYDMKNLSPSEWDKLIVRLYKDDKAFQIMYRAFRKQYITEPCHDAACRRTFLCAMVDSMNSYFHDFCNLNAEERGHYEKWKARTYNAC